jgi:integrase
LLRHLRDRALLMMGFWRGFRGDELTRLEAQHIEVVSGQGLICYLHRSKGDRQYDGRSFKVPALNRLCPVDAYLAWTSAAAISSGPVFRAIDRWGHLSSISLHEDSLVPLIRRTLRLSEVEDSDLYSGHSLRRGFATWANANGWDVAALMSYVGWKDVKSALRYIESPDTFSRSRINASSPRHSWAWSGASVLSGDGVDALDRILQRMQLTVHHRHQVAWRYL